MAKSSRNSNFFNKDLINADTSLGKMILALCDEIDVVQKNAKTATLKDGDFVEQIGNQYIYEFLLVMDFPFDENDDVFVESEGRDIVRGTVVKVDLNTVQIAFEEDLDKRIDKIQITSSDGAQLTILRSQLKKIHDKDLKHNEKSSNLSIGDLTPSVKKSGIPGSVQRFLNNTGFILNDEQDDAIAKSVETDCVMLWGPPGTGKTFTLGLMVLGYLEQNKSVLLVSNTNKAVDQSLKAVLESIYGAGEYKEGDKSILRLGSGITDTISNVKSLPEWLRKVTPEEILADQQKELQAKLKDLEEAREKIQSKYNKRDAERGIWVKKKEFDDLLISIKGELKSLPDQIQKGRNQIAGIQSDLQKLQDEFQSAPENETIKTKLGFQKTRLELARDIQAINRKLDVEKGNLQEILDESTVKERKYRETEYNASLYKEKTSALEPLSLIQAEIDDLSDKLSDLDSDITEINAELNNLRQKLIQNADVIATTVYGVFSKPEIAEREYDVVIIDEASMVVLPMTYFAAGKAKKQVVIVGDFKQLPAITQAETDIVKDWLSDTPFHKFNIIKLLKDDNLPDYLVGLREQNRMQDAISNLISSKFYNNRLVVGPRVALQKQLKTPSFGKEGKRIYWIDTTDLGGWSAHRFGESSLFNVSHAAIVGGIVDQLITDGTITQEGKEDNIGIVAPYAAQCELIKNLLSDRQEYVSPSSIGTAHKFQGSERDIIIFDYVLNGTKTKSPGRFLNAESPEEAAGCLLNVALSRAKQNLILIFDSRPFLGTRSSKFMQGFFKTVMRDGVQLDPTLFLEQTDIFDKARKLSIGKHFTVGEPTTLHTEASFYPAITDDFKNAKKSILIYSAFITPNRLKYWFPIFSECLERGVDIRIMSRTISEQPKSKGGHDELIELLPIMRQAGITYEMKEKLHEKTIIIDDEITWFGSLNMLSQNQSSEQMTRLVSQSYAKELSHQLARHDLKQKDDLLASQFPVCPDCGSNTLLRTVTGGKNLLECESKCGWGVMQWHFAKLMKAIPMRVKKDTCLSCKKGDLRLDQNYEGFLWVCSNKNNKKSKVDCDYSEKATIQGLSYNPFPSKENFKPNVLKGFQSGFHSNPVTSTKASPQKEQKEFKPEYKSNKTKAHPLKKQQSKLDELRKKIRTQYK